MRFSRCRSNGYLKFVYCPQRALVDTHNDFGCVIGCDTPASCRGIHGQCVVISVCIGRFLFDQFCPPACRINRSQRFSAGDFHTEVFHIVVRKCRSGIFYLTRQGRGYRQCIFRSVRPQYGENSAVFTQLS